jgi:hypothetical protein
MTVIHYIGLDVHKKTINYCIKTAAGQKIRGETEVALWEPQQGEERRGQTGMVLKEIRNPQNLPFRSRLLCEIGPSDLPPCAMANGKHPHRLPLFVHFIDNPINVRLLTVKQMPHFSL